MKINFVNRILIITFFNSLLGACDSGLSGQIEKCVQAALAANGPYKDSKDKADTEISARGFCLRAASGKD
jgi:hypothetical protein